MRNALKAISEWERTHINEEQSKSGKFWKARESNSYKKSTART